VNDASSSNRRSVDPAVETRAAHSSYFTDFFRARHRETWCRVPIFLSPPRAFLVFPVARSALPWDGSIAGASLNLKIRVRAPVNAGRVHAPRSRGPLRYFLITTYELHPPAIPRPCLVREVVHLPWTRYRAPTRSRRLR